MGRHVAAVLFCLFIMSVLHLPHSVFLPYFPLGERKMLPKIHPTCLINMDKSCISVKGLFKTEEAFLKEKLLKSCHVAGLPHPATQRQVNPG